MYRPLLPGQHPGRSSTVENAGPAAAVGKRTLTADADAGPAAAGPGKRTLSEIHTAAGRGTATSASALPHADRIQRMFGRHDVSSIQAHASPEAAASAQAMGAEAYAAGNHVVFAGAPDLHTAAHEAAHVVQQRGGVQLKGGVGAEGDSHEQHADAVADLVVAGRSAESLLDAAAGGGAPTAGVQGKFLATGGEARFVDMDTNDAYQLVRRTDSYLIVRRDRDGLEARVDAHTMEPIENEHQRGFRLGKAPDPQAQQPMVDVHVPYQPPSVFELYRRMFPNGETFQQKSLQEVSEDQEIAKVRELAKQVEQLKARARSGDQDARGALPNVGKQLEESGNALTQKLFGRVESYKDFLFLMDQFLAGKLANNPVYNGLLWSETDTLIGQLRTITQFGLTTWESQPSNQEEPIQGHKDIKMRQFAFLELSGPAELVAGLVEQLAPMTSIAIIRPGDTRRVPLKQFRCRSLEKLQALTGGAPEYTPPQKKGSLYCTNWLDQITNNAKYVGKAIQKVPSLDQVIGGHTYLHLISKDAENATALFDAVIAILPKVKPVVARNNEHHQDNQGGQHEDGGEHDAEKEHLESYSTTAFSGNLT